jgi:acetyl-CoA carboxylase biotin carboxyl carrier protein
MMPELEHLAALLESHNLSRLEYEQGDMRVVMERSPEPDSRQAAWRTGAAGGACAAAPAPAEGTAALAAPDAAAALTPAPAPDADPAASNLLTVSAPLVGIVYRSREPGAPPLVECGQRVAKGDVLCLIEAMKLFNEITAPSAGTVETILFEDGALAEYGAALVTLRPEPQGAPPSTPAPPPTSAPAPTAPLAPTPLG